jgi:hypothetical protein
MPYYRPHVPRSCVPLLLFLACHRQSAEPAVSHAPGQVGNSSITGHVSFHGEPPPAPSTATKLGFPDCARFAGGPRDPGLIVSPAGGVRDAFVWIRDGVPPGEYPVPQTPVTLDQRGCEFVPRVFGIRAGQTLVLTSSDPFLHNVHGAAAFNVPMPTAGARLEKSFAHTGVMTPILCDVHNWMRAFAGVVPHPFWAVTADDGSFRISQLPPGKYTVEVWQERLGWRRTEVTLGGNETRAISIDYTRAP